MISKWMAKAVVQKSISFLPAKEKINYWFQKNITKGAILSDNYFEYKITHAKDHLKFFRKHSILPLSECEVLELGTGWYPIVPIMFFLNDLKVNYSIDLRNWMTKENIIVTCQKFVEWDKSGKLQPYLENINIGNWEIIKQIANGTELSLEELCSRINLQTWIGDARNMEAPNNSIDLICSNNTFEHIPKHILSPIIEEFNRVIKPQGVMSHFIDMSDHFAHFDSSINIYNFLRYSDRAWHFIDNSIQPQNRMRFRDYKEIYNELNLPVTEVEVRKGDIESLQTIPLNQKYTDYTLEELAISHGYIVSKLSLENGA